MKWVRLGSFAFFVWALALPAGADDGCSWSNCPMGQGCGFCKTLNTSGDDCTEACNGSAGQEVGSPISCGEPAKEYIVCGCSTEPCGEG